MRFADPELFLLARAGAATALAAASRRRGLGRWRDSAALAGSAARDGAQPNLARAHAALLASAASCRDRPDHRGLGASQTSDAESAIPAEGIDVVLTIDVSRSMILQQLSGNTRLDAAREVARDFVAQRGNDRVGVVVFQAESLVLSPLTLDLEAVDTLLENSVRNGLLREGTALGLALAESIDLLRGSEAPSRVVVALTDGEDNIRIVRPVEAAAIARALDIRIYTIGVTRADASAATVDELALRFLAEETGGQYFRATQSNELREAYAEIDALEKARVGVETFTRFVDLAAWLLVPGILLILLELAAHATWWRRAP